jgi:ribose 5-phosphate isomerase B
MKVYIAADHRGYHLKEKIFQWLVDEGYKVEDYGAYELDPKDDYPLFAEKVGSVVGKDNKARGILLCGGGTGVNVVANKFDRIRASIGINTKQVKVGRNDDDMNILVIAADFTKENQVKEMAKVFLETKFSGKPRHKKRLEEITRIEANN